MKYLLAVVLLAFSMHAQEPPPDPELEEQFQLSQALNDAGTSAIDQIRAMEAHLKKFPASKQRAAIEENLARAAMESNDDARIALYGEKVLHAKDDLTMIERLTRSLLQLWQAAKALTFARRYEAGIESMSTQPPPGHLTPGQWSDEVDRAMARALALDARATGDTGEPEAAAKLAQKSRESYPTGEGAREVAFWQKQLGHDQAAIDYYADAFTLEDPRTTEADRTQDRKRLGELYGSGKGLGDAILQAYDRTAALLADRQARLKKIDPNAVAANPAEFVLPPVVVGAGTPLALASLKGKAVIMDFWATWCAPAARRSPSSRP